jgi:hypothetical protein
VLNVKLPVATEKHLNVLYKALRRHGRAQLVSTLYDIRLFTCYKMFPYFLVIFQIMSVLVWFSVRYVTESLTTVGITRNRDLVHFDRSKGQNLLQFYFWPWQSDLIL